MLFLYLDTDTSVHHLAKYVVGPQGLGQDKVSDQAKKLQAGPKTPKDMQIADVIYIFQPTKFSNLIHTLNKLIFTLQHMFTNIVINLLTRGL